MTRLNDTQLATWRTFITAHARLIDVIDKELAAAECLPLFKYDVLIELADAPERKLRMSDLADKVVLTRGGLSHLVDRLEKEGYISREPDPVDRRGSYAVLTDAGRAALSQAWSVYAKGILSHFAAHLNENELQILTAAFTRMVDDLKKSPDE